jgi:hypothetical protein
MRYIDPIFTSLDHKTPKDNKVMPRPKSEKIRRVRSDKTHDVKFPVDTLLSMKLRTLCKQAARTSYEKREKPLTQTKFNTCLLRHGLKHQELILWDQEYRDPKGKYMHTTLLESEYSDIGGPYGIAIRNNLSERKTVFLIISSMVNWLERGGSIEEVLQ